MTRMLDKFKDECAVFGIAGHPEASNLAYLGLYAMQHRGQESAGIAAADGHRVIVSKDMGYVADIFNSDRAGHADGHVRHRPYPLLHGRRQPPDQRPADPHRLRARADRHRP